MCGIAGGYNVPRGTLEKMLAHQHSRGPDYTGIQKIGNVIFGHNRLAIVDRSEKSNQPIVEPDRMLSYNGEIYNYDREYYPSDTVDLFHAIQPLWEAERKIAETLNDLNGMFAFALYENDTILLVRDRFGIKPLYYTHQKDFFAFASTPAALTYTKPNWEISQKGVQEYLSLGATMLHSMFEGIVAVPPGHYVTFNIRDNTVKTTRWYYPKFIENAKEVIKEKVIQAIDRVKLTCDWPQIILLSGGIDSSLVASRYHSLSGIHLSSPEKEYSERVANTYGIHLIHVDPCNESAEQGLTDFITKSGEPTMAGLIPWITCKEIAKAGYRVAITANGADELFFGYERMKDITDQMQHIFRQFPFTNMTISDNLAPFIHHFGPNQWFEICTYLMFDLNKTLDYASMCHSVEVRVPYLDHELVEAALSIPMEQHVAKYGNKHILKEMLLELGFDYEFIHRPKVGFSLHNTPYDWHTLQDKAKKWYERSGYEQLPVNSTPRQEAYHQSTITGLYLWHKIWKHE